MFTLPQHIVHHAILGVVSGGGVLVTGAGTTNYIPMYTDGPNGVIGNSGLFYDTSLYSTSAIAAPQLVVNPALNTPGTSFGQWSGNSLTGLQTMAIGFGTDPEWRFTSRTTVTNDAATNFAIRRTTGGVGNYGTGWAVSNIGTQTLTMTSDTTATVKGHLLIPSASWSVGATYFEVQDSSGNAKLAMRRITGGTEQVALQIGFSSANYLQISQQAGGANNMKIDAVGGGLPEFIPVVQFDAKDTHLVGLSIGTPSSTTAAPIESVIADSATSIGFDMNDTITRTQGFARKLRVGSTTIESVSWDGRFSFGLTAVPLANTILGFAMNDTTNTAINSGIFASIAHGNTSVTAAQDIAIQGQALTTTATGFTATVLAGMVGGIGSTADSSFAGAVAACFAGDVTRAGRSTPTATKEASLAKNAQIAGAFDHMTIFWAPNISSASATGYPTNTPAITSAIRVTIQDFGGPTTDAANTKEQWAVYGEHVNGADDVFPAVTGFLRMTYPRRTGKTAGGQGRGMHAWWEPWPNTATIRGAAAEGDTYFDDNTNFTGGLWEFSGIAGGANAWNYLLSSPGVNALGGGAAATLGTIGGGGPAAAAQATWVKMNCADNVVRWVPAWV